MTATTIAPVDVVLSKLEARQTGSNQWEACCPAHDDRSPSLGVSVGSEDQALLHCQAGCDFLSVLSALELTERDLWPANGHHGSAEQPKKTVRYTYTDEAGVPLYDVVRTEPGRDGKAKGFHQEPANGKRGKGAMSGVRPVLYRLPEVVDAVANGQPVWIVEGEKDADAVVRTTGEVATCNPTGAGKWSKVPDATDHLAGADVIVWVDDDKAGHAHGRDVIASIDGKAQQWMVVRSTSAKDAAEHLGAGRSADELEVLAQSDGDRTWLDGEITEPEQDDVDPDEPEVDYVDHRGLPGGDAILDQPEQVPAIWGEGAEVLWPEGEPAMIAAPPGVGKTTLGQQVVLGALGLRSEVLGYPVNGGNRRILYLAMDRPRQIRRSFRRMVTEADRQVLNDRLVIREGPPPGDLASDPTILVQLARWHDADMIVVDSLKDACIKLTDDETAGKANRAIQSAIAEGIDILILHHQRKGQGGEKPKRLEDVYGNTWITAGLGSVVLLWGAAGDPIVELFHLKQPADEVGPFKIEHDHATGTSSVYHGFDLLRYLRLKPDGVTSRQVAVAMLEKHQPTDSEMKKAKRKLDAAVARGIATYQPATAGGEGGSTPARYFLAQEGSR